MNRALHLHISGRVQGVGFREACRRAAGKAGAVGWVQNLPDGRVEAWVEGPPDAVDHLAAWCQHGPSWATVTRCEISDAEPQGFDTFRIR